MPDTDDKLQAIAEAMVCLLHLPNIPLEQRPFVSGVGARRLRDRFDFSPLTKVLNDMLEDNDGPAS